MLMGEIGVHEKQLCESHSRCLGAAHGRVELPCTRIGRVGGGQTSGGRGQDSMWVHAKSEVSIDI